MSMHRKNFTPSDDALILEQPVSRIGIEKLATMLHTSPGRVMRRADELGVSLALRYHDEAFDTRAHRCTDGRIDPLAVIPTVVPAAPTLICMSKTELRASAVRCAAATTGWAGARFFVVLYITKGLGESVGISTAVLATVALLDCDVEAAARR